MAAKPEPQASEAMYQGKVGWIRRWNIIVAGLLLIAGFAGVASWVGWGAHVLEWLNLLLRWFHVVVGIGWIGASFYFIWLENSLERQEVPEHLAGQLYSVHGGGFYLVQKYKAAPDKLPDTLHWFQWDAYLTFLSGFGLLMIVYYANAEFVMVNARLKLPAFMLIAIGLLVLGAGWLVYDRLCRSKLVDNKPLFAATGFVLVTVLALVLTQVLSPRAAYMHVGAMLGTLMAWNVFFVIIPAHRIMVKAAQAGTVPDPGFAKNASLRSLHNNYMTLPVIFVMISNHYPMTFGYTYNWLVLALLFLASAGIRHYLNLHERGVAAQWILPAASAIVLALALVTAPSMRPLRQGQAQLAEATISFEEVQQIIENRCVSCHAQSPSDSTFSAPPKGIVFDSSEAIRAQAQLIYQNAVISDYMPLGNKTGMLPEEREKLGIWYQGR
jgi:uncharacterized membrane protein